MAWRPWKASNQGGSESDDNVSAKAARSVADLLEIFGKKGFDTSTQSQAELERLSVLWARHVRRGDPIPGSEDVGDDGSAEPSWEGVHVSLKYSANTSVVMLVNSEIRSIQRPKVSMNSSEHSKILRRAFDTPSGKTKSLMKRWSVS